MGRDFLFHVAGLVLLLVAYGCNFAGDYMLTKGYRNDLAVFGMGVMTMVAVLTIVALLFPLSCRRSQRYDVALALTGGFYGVCAVLHLLAWIFSYAFYHTLFHPSSFLLGMGTSWFGISCIVHFTPEIFDIRFHGDNDTQQRRPKQPMPSYYVLTASNCGQQGHPPYPCKHHPVSRTRSLPDSTSQESPQQLSTLSSSSPSLIHPPKLSSTPQESPEEEKEAAGSGRALRLRPRQGRGQDGQGNTRSFRRRSRSRSASRSVVSERTSRSRERTRLGEARRSRDRRGGRGAGGGTIQPARGRRTRSRSLSRKMN